MGFRYGLGLEGLGLHRLWETLGHFQVGSYRFWSLIEGLYLLEALLEALYTLNSPPVVSFNPKP